MADKLWRVIVWAAVSSKPQAGEDKESLPQQEAAGRAFAESVGGQVVDILTVPGHSRELILWSHAEAAMIAYRDLREHCEQDDFDVLWARSPDRLGRDPALIAQVESLVERRNSGREVFYSDTPHQLGNKSTSMRFVSSIRGVTAKLDIEELVRRQRMGMRGRVRRGLPACHWPYGYVPVKDTAGRTISAKFGPGVEAVRFATRLYLRGVSYKEIAAALNASGYDTARGRQWWPGAVTRLLHNDAYAGRPSWGGVRCEEASPHYPAVWDDATWRQIVLERENRRMKKYRRPESSPFLDVAFCGRCGGRMVLKRDRGHKRRSDSTLLLCAAHGRDASACHRNAIDLADVFKSVLEWLSDNLDPETYAANVGPEPGRSERDELAEAERQIAVVEAKRTRLGHVVAGGKMAFDVYFRVDTDLNAQLVTLNLSAQHLRELLASMPDRVAHRGELVRLAALDLLSAPWQEINAALLRLGVRVEVEDRQVVGVAFV